MRLTDEQLGEAVEAALGKLTPRARRFAELVAGGTSFVEAAAQAGLSAERRSLQRLKVRTAPALAVLREQARRASLLTLEVAVQRFRQLSDEARDAKDYGAATRALREAALLVGLYPEARLRLSVEQTALTHVTPEEWEALSQLRHRVRQALPAAAAVVDAEALPAPPGAADAPPTPETTS